MPLGNLVYRRGDIRWIRLDPTVGAEAQKTRSCLILQNDIMNQYGQLTIVMPFRPGSKQAPYAVNVKATPTNGLDKDRFLDVGQLRAVDNQRVLGQLGVLEGALLASAKNSPGYRLRVCSLASLFFQSL